MAELTHLRESIDQLQAMRREIEQRLAAARAAEVAKQTEGPKPSPPPTNVK